MNSLKESLFLFSSLALLTGCEPKSEKPATDTGPVKQQKEALIIGTFHYHNPGLDAAKVKDFDVLSERSQEELKLMAEKIRDFKPGKIFVEWPYDGQEQLDSLYRLYLEDSYFDNESLTDFYRKNEIFQLGFRAARKSKLARVHAIDYRDTQFPLDSLMTVLKQNNQSSLLAEIDESIQYFTTSFDSRIESGTSLLELTYYLNSKELRDLGNRMHLEIPLMGGKRENFIGPFLSAEWQRRNLYMWSLAQKGTEAEDRRIVLLLGSSHIATIKDYIDQNTDWNAVELKEIME